MLQRPSIHGDQRRMDDAAGIHQRAGQRVAAILDHAGKGFIDDGKRMILADERKHAGRQALGAHGDGDFERAMLARQPGQGAGFGESRLRLVARMRASLARTASSRRCRAADR